MNDAPEGQLSSLRSVVRSYLSEPPYLSVRRSPQPLVLARGLFLGLLVYGLLVNACIGALKLFCRARYSL
jgi:hypothetical protein